MFQRFATGLKHGWHTPMLPAKVIAFNNYPLVRIFRVVGGLSVLTVLLKKTFIITITFTIFSIIYCLSKYFLFCCN